MPAPGAIDSSRWTGRYQPTKVRFLLSDPSPYIFSLELEDNASRRKHRGTSGIEGGFPRPDIFGQTAAVETLHDLCLEALGYRRDGSIGNRQTTTIALYGRYGQGKSTVLTRVRQLLEPEVPFGVPIRIGDFDVAAFRPDLISFEFDRLVADWTLKARTTLLVIFVFLFASVYFLYTWLGFSWDTTTFAAALTTVVIPWLVKPMRDGLARAAVAEQGLLRKIEAALRFGDGRNLRALLTGVLVGRPDVLFVDNLDRATVDQQRAFLRSLRRHRHSLPTVVVVAFDETPLTLSDPNPEAPQELLAKIFTTAVRLYPMTANDVLGIVSHLYDRLISEQGADDRSPLRFLRYPAVAGDLARILFAHRRHSVRFCYQFLNIVSTASATLEIDHPADFSAVMRLQGLFEFLPWIRHDPFALADMLAENDATGLLDYAASILGKEKLSSEVTNAVRAYVVTTNHMQPYFSDWHAFTGRFGLLTGERERSPEPPTTAGPRNRAAKPRFWFPDLLEATQTKSDVRTLWVEWVETDLKASAERNPLRRRQIYDAVTRNFGNSLSLIEQEHPTLDAADDRWEKSQRIRSARVLAASFLAHRLWFADAEAAERPPLVNDENAPGLDILLDGKSMKGVEPSSLSISMQAMLLDAEVRNAFLQITRATPIEILPFFETIVASSSFRQGDLIRPTDGERRRLNGLETRAGERVRGQLPTLFGKVLDPSRRAVHVIASLDPLEVPADATAFDWLKVRRRIDTLGRLERANCHGVLSSVRPFIEAAVERHGHDIDILRKLVEAMAEAFPAFGARDDGVWRRKVFEPFDPLVQALFRSDARSQNIKVFRGISGSDVTPQVILMILHYGIPSASRDRLETFEPFKAVFVGWNPRYPWPLSYIECIAEIVRDVVSSRENLGCDTHRVLLHNRFSKFLHRAMSSVEDDPLTQTLVERLTVPPLPGTAVQTLR